MNSEDVRQLVAQRASLRKTSRRVTDQIRSADAALAKYAEAPLPTPNRRETGDALLEAARREADQAAARADAYSHQTYAVTRLEGELRAAKALRTALVVATVAVVVVMVVIAALWWLIAG